MKIKLLALMLFLSSLAFATNEESYNINNEADCIILADENSIICKFITQPSNEDQEVKLLWIGPKNIIQRERDITISAKNSSIYDYRFLDGRDKGTWTFKVLKGEEELASTTFEIE
ncbi:MAG: hypothetical protein RBQ81_06220 [Arcobacteraceae bacterium]|jgi:hypothetical protein|nr:hypothetical protein [Arcobacteraceae bacterium]